jgi:hypothetical protein
LVIAVCLLAAAVVAPPARATPHDAPHAPDPAALRSELLAPRDGSDGERPYPLIVIVRAVSSSRLDRAGAIGRYLHSDPVQTEYPSFLLSVYVARGSVTGRRTGASGDIRGDATSSDDVVASILDRITRVMDEAAVDPSRVYVTGEGAGADLVWKLLGRYPDRFAAAVIVSGDAELGIAERVERLPLWVFHGEGDDRVPVARARAIVSAAWAAGATGLRYTELKRSGGDVGLRAWQEGRLLPWLFSQSRE